MSVTENPARTPKPPYYAVIFTSVRTAHDGEYEKTASRMNNLAQQQPGFLGADSLREGTLGITVSYWESLEAILAWKRDAEHAEAQARGRAEWYDWYSVRVARVERAYDFDRNAQRGRGRANPAEDA